MPRPPRDHPLTVKVNRAPSGHIGTIVGHHLEILWECPPRSDGHDDPRLPAHHNPHATDEAARECAQGVLVQGQLEGWWS
jgi:hypothetical protein